MRGLITPTSTPFTANLEVDTELYIQHSLNLLEKGCVGLVPFGTTGEALSVGLAERKKALRSLVDAGISAQNLLPGVGLCNEHETLELIEQATGLGCHGVLVLPPFYYKDVSDEGLLRYYSRLIEKCAQWNGVRIYLYHIPQVSGVGLSVELIARLYSEFPQIIAGIKDSSGDWANTSAILKKTPSLEVFPGSENDLLRALAAGAAGCITASGNVNSQTIATLFDDAPQTELQARQLAVNSFSDILRSYPLIPALKWLLADTSGNSAWQLVRPPLMELPRAMGEELILKLRQAQFIE